MGKITVCKELIDLLDKCGIEDFDAFYPMLNADPQVNEPGYGTPYHFGKVAFFEYKDWRVQGAITVHKPKK